MEWLTLLFGLVLPLGLLLGLAYVVSLIARMSGGTRNKIKSKRKGLKQWQEK